MSKCLLWSSISFLLILSACQSEEEEWRERAERTTKRMHEKMLKSTDPGDVLRNARAYMQPGTARDAVIKHGLELMHAEAHPLQARQDWEGLRELAWRLPPRHASELISYFPPGERPRLKEPLSFYQPPAKQRTDMDVCLSKGITRSTCVRLIPSLRQF